MAILKKLAKKIWLQRIEPRLLAAPLTVQLTQHALHSTEKGITGDTDLIISLTTYGKRIHEVYLPIESLLQQTLKPGKIILWLSKDEFNENNIPLILKKQRERGLEIAYCEDLRSYKKLIPTLQVYPNATIITVDDDVIYPFDLLENLMRGHKENPNTVICYRCHKFTYNNSGKLKPYCKWLTDYKGEELCFDTLPTGVGGILYPPNCFHKDVLQKDLFTKLAPTADDVWFKAMTLLNGIPCKKTSFVTKIITLQNNQDTALERINVAGKRNNIQIKQVFDYYKIPLLYSGVKKFQNL
jgi:hypothetical protein